MPRISVIIPTLNEAPTLTQTLTHIPNTPNIEIIIADGGSTDRTLTIATQLHPNAIVLTTAPGRAHQMNQAAAIAQGHLLVFLHADTHLPPDWLTHIETTLAQPGTIAGAFHLKINSPKFSRRLIEWGSNRRSRHCQLPYGDQAIFLKRETFEAIGGFPDLPIMEDFQLIKTLQKRGKITLAPAAVTTDDRRWATVGIWQTTLLNQLMILGFYLGINPDRLRQWYRQAAHRRISPPSQSSADRLN
jgi:rSAM/selenodomain-associated transferase 2